MLINFSHRNWAFGTIIASLVSALFYLMCFHPEMMQKLFPYRLPDWFKMDPRPQHTSVGNSPLGLLYGTFSFGVFVFAVLLAFRRKFPLLRLGKVQYWLKAHIWLTLLTIPLVFMHAQFKFGGTQTSVLMYLYIIVMVSGIYGVVLQNVLPTYMRERLPLETVFEQIPFLTARILDSAVRLRDDIRETVQQAATLGSHAAAPVVALAGEASTIKEHDESAETILEAMERDIIPFLAATTGEGRLSDGRLAEEFFNLLRLKTKPEYHPKVDAVETWCAERRSMDAQAKYQHRLHLWILIHAPISFILVGMTAWHAVAWLIFY